jgi:hypothetical protein
MLAHWVFHSLFLVHKALHLVVPYCPVQVDLEASVHVVQEELLQRDQALKHFYPSILGQEDLVVQAVTNQVPYYKAKTSTRLVKKNTNSRCLIK